MKILKRIMVRFKGLSSTDDKSPVNPDSSSAVLLVILDARIVLHRHIDISARDGFVPDALPLSLFDNHKQELAERHRQLEVAQQDYQACLSRLEAMFPEPEPPLPAPRPAQVFPRISNVLGERHPSRKVS